MTCTGPSLLAEEDRISLRQLAPAEVQEWCLSRINKYQGENRRLTKEVSKNKSHMRAFRSVYNDAAPINQHLLPEMLMQIFSHVHPAVVPRSHIPVLRVCRYWRRLLFHTSEFWDNLLSLPTWNGWNPRYHISPFQAALARSAYASLSLSVPYYSQAIASTLIPHARRLSLFKAGPTVSNPEEMTLSQLKEEILYRPHHCWGPFGNYTVFRNEKWRTSALTFSFPLFPNLRSLELRKTYIRAPISLSHLKLDQCAIRLSSSGGGLISPLVVVHTALKSFPNLEVLSLIRCLSPPGNPGAVAGVLVVPDLKETVHLPRLRLLELEDTPAYVPLFLSHLIFPATAALVLELAYAYNGSQGPAVVPLFPHINPSPSPDAQLTLSLHTPAADGGTLAHWETHGERVRPVHVTLPHAAFTSPLITTFTRELADALAPRHGVTAIVVHGRYRYTESTPEQYWEELTRALPELRRLACDTAWATKALTAALGQREAGGGAFPCACLERRGWDGASRIGWTWGLPADSGEHCSGWTKGVLAIIDQSAKFKQSAKELAPELQLARKLSDFRDTVRPYLAVRTGHCEPIGKLVVSLHCKHFRCKCGDPVLDGWQAVLIEECLRNALGDLVGNIVVRVGGYVG